MNRQMIKSVVLAVVTTAATLVAASAHAGGVSWSIGIDAAPIGAVVSGGPGYRPYPVHERRVYAPAPVYVRAPVYAPAPVYVPAPPVYRVPPRVAYYPPAVVYRPVPVVYPRYYRDDHRGHPHGPDRGWRGDHDRWDHRR